KGPAAGRDVTMSPRGLHHPYRFPSETSMQPDGSTTSASLLLRLGDRPSDQAAWGEFVDRYGGIIYSWCRGSGLQDADAQDVTQAVLTQLAVQLGRFAYDPSRRFRGWLRT